MGLDTLVRKLVKLGANLASDFMPEVVHEKFTGAYDTNGQPTYRRAVKRRAVIESINLMVRTDTNGEQLAKSRLLFLERFAATNDDRFTLPDETQPKILTIDRGVLARDGTEFLLQVYF